MPFTDCGNGPKRQWPPATGCLELDHTGSGSIGKNRDSDHRMPCMFTGSRNPASPNLNAGSRDRLVPRMSEAVPGTVTGCPVVSGLMVVSGGCAPIEHRYSRDHLPIGDFTGPGRLAIPCEGLIHPPSGQTARQVPAGSALNWKHGLGLTVNPMAGRCLPEGRRLDDREFC